MKTLALFFVLIFGVLPIGYSQSSVSVTVSGIQNQKGTIYLALFDNSKSFPIKGKQYKGVRLEAIGSSVNYVFKNLPEGKYAVSVYHDENGNGRLDKNIFGAPTEAYAFSRNARGYFGPPDFSAAAIFINNGQSRNLTIDLKK
jgi:uncharacterized protein (DUF2141 family)